MASHLIKDVKKVLAGKGGRLDDEEQEYLAREITKLGFKLGFARAYASGPSLMAELVRRLEQREEQLKQIRKLVGYE